MSEPLRLTVASAADAAAATAAAMSLIYAASPSTTALEITLPAGDLSDLTLQVGGPLDPRHLDVTIRGQGTVLRRSHLDITGASVTLVGLRLEGPQDSSGALRLHGVRALHLQDLAVTALPADGGGEAMGSRSEGGILFEALGPDVTATIVDSRFLHNRYAPLLVFRGQPGGAFRSVTLHNSRFGDNAAPDIFAGPVRQLTATDCQRIGDGEFLQVQDAATLVLDTPEELPPSPDTLRAWEASP